MKLLAHAVRLLVVGACWPALLHAAVEPPPTVIESSGLTEMISTDTETTFTFRDHVIVTGNNIRITCDLLVVVARRTGDVAATLGKQENFKSLVATGHVTILQTEREATCGRAEVFPGDDKVVLSENPVVRDTGNHSEATGPRMILYRGQRRAVIEAEPGAPSRITLPGLKDLGYDKSAPATDTAPKPESPK
jgi:lipopolysaccharide export system protein LptA